MSRRASLRATSSAPSNSGYLHPTSDTAPVQAQAQDVQDVSPGAELAGEWWQLFHSAQLDEVVRASIAASPTLVAANATLAQAREEVTEARGAPLSSNKHSRTTSAISSRRRI
jgi:outer membrane protein TolC